MSEWVLSQTSGEKPAAPTRGQRNDASASTEGDGGDDEVEEEEEINIADLVPRNDIRSVRVVTFS